MTSWKKITLAALLLAFATPALRADLTATADTKTVLKKRTLQDGNQYKLTATADVVPVKLGLTVNLACTWTTSAKANNSGLLKGTLVFTEAGKGRLYEASYGGVSVQPVDDENSNEVLVVTIVGPAKSSAKAEDIEVLWHMEHQPLNSSDKVQWLDRTSDTAEIEQLEKVSPCRTVIHIQPPNP